MTAVMCVWLAACGANAADGDDGGPPDALGPPECAANTDCVEPDAPICSPDAVCVGCKEDNECKAIDQSAPLCAADGACVACRGAADCSDPTAPVCDSETRSCRACGADAECESGVCDLDEGTCFATSDVYIVDDGAACGTGDGSAGAPFCTIAEALAAFAAAPRNFISVRDGQYTFPPLASSPLPGFIGTAAAQVGPVAVGDDCLQLDTSARLLLRGFHFAGCDVALRLGATATQVSVTNTIVDTSETGIDCRADLCVVKGVQVSDTKTGVSCSGGARCTILDSSISGGNFGVVTATAQLQLHDSTVSGSRVSGLDLTDSEIEVRHVTVSGVGVGGTGPTAGVGCAGGYCTFDRVRIVGSRGPGLFISNSSFEVYSSAILDNGSDDPSLSPNGGVVITQPGATKIFQNNTVVGNRAAGTAVAGVRCAAPITLRSSIVWGNSGSPIDAACSAIYSDIDVPTAVLAGIGNIRLDPKLSSMTPGSMDEHIAADSPCIDKGDPAGGPAADIDGQARPSGARVDIGADEQLP